MDMFFLGCGLFIVALGSMQFRSVEDKTINYLFIYLFIYIFIDISCQKNKKYFLYRIIYLFIAYIVVKYSSQ